MLKNRLLLVSAVLGTVAASTAQAQDQIWAQVGEDGVFFGVAVSIAPDVDGDDLDDVIVGDYQYSGGSGGAFVYSGGTGELVRSWVGEPGLNGLGRAVTGLGDVDGDGFGDVAAAAFWANGTPGIYVGRVYAYSGRTGEEIWSRLGEDDQDYFGRSLARLGDLTGDGVGELAVASDFHDGPAGIESGRVYALDGATGDVLWSADGEATGDHFGEGLAALGDVDSDGIDDVVVGTPRHAERRGKVYVLSGASGELLYTALGQSIGEGFGFRVAGVGNLGGDKRSDILVGSPWYDGAAGEDSGRVTLLSGKDGATLWSEEGDRPLIRLGQAVAAAGDVNQDGTPDLLIGASHRSDAGTPGEAWLISGHTLDLLWRWEGRRDGDQFGLALDGGGDLDGDKLPDVAIGAYQHRGSGGQGRVVTYRGNDLFLEVTPSHPFAWDTLQLHTRGGLQKIRTTLYVVEIGGVPTLLPVASDRLDKDGEWVFEALVPPGLEGLEVRFQSISERGQRVHDSNTPLVRFR